MSCLTIAWLLRGLAALPARPWERPAQPRFDACAPPPSRGAAAYTLSAAREAEPLREAESLGENTFLFLGRRARRIIWSSRIHLAAERGAADLVRTPFPEDAPPLTRTEIHALRDKVELLRVTQSRWQAAQ